MRVKARDRRRALGLDARATMSGRGLSPFSWALYLFRLGLYVLFAHPAHPPNDRTRSMRRWKQRFVCGPGELSPRQILSKAALPSLSVRNLEQLAMADGMSQGLWSCSHDTRQPDRLILYFCILKLDVPCHFSLFRLRFARSSWACAALVV